MQTLIERKLVEMYQKLSDGERELLNALNEELEIIPTSSIQKLAEKKFVSVTSLHRTIKKIGFQGYSDFKYQIANELAQSEMETKEPLAFSEKLIDEMVCTLKINQEKLEKIGQQIAQTTDLYCFGTGWRQKQILDNFANDLLYYRKQIKMLRTAEDLLISTHHMTKKSLVIIASIYGKTDNYIEALKNCKAKNVAIISITLDQENNLSEEATHSLFFKDSSVGSNNKHWNALTLSFLVEMLIQSILNFIPNTKLEK
ncbi:MurR/RpiR family transcriptional regulator [Enterococcus sp. BWB1-3]|uniref:MurR/RpiR family transcriptional regulator n=1 Tax=unclassified Enterococcus TaxID=2608891 RepID=UPI0019232F5B|nr:MULTISPECIES: MurR/RpiR family transcriptional regulator [unclassified Enterococcus]MBL1230495.1 MurR/RpiR family transcriptional regulator [Enterococcus sp. BWB1-3]MCB5954210.1 MurR/RpiR family transcriptional regulator [Enterococcus sp. CWB-B31]